ncbi:MAG: hypothetical protein ABI769_14895 [Pseudomonadota bacterium]
MIAIDGHHPRPANPDCAVILSQIGLIAYKATADFDAFRRISH